MNWTIIPARRFPEFADRWQILHAQGSASPLLASEFAGALLDHFATGRELLALHGMPDRPDAMALLAPSGAGRWQTFQPAQAPIGLWLQRPDADTAALARALLARLPGLGLVLGLTQCDPELQARPADGPHIRTLDYIDTARISIERPFEEYWQERGKNLRSNLKKQRARLERDGVGVTLDVLRDRLDMAGAVADYARLESAGWKADRGTAVGAADAQGRFYRALLEAFCQRGAGVVYRYRFNERPVAVDLCVEGADSIVVLKTTYDETVAQSLSPALLMREQACRQLFGERRLRRIEFYGKVMDWHLRWTDEVRTLYHLNTYRWPVLRNWHGRLQARPACTPSKEQPCT